MQIPKAIDIPLGQWGTKRDRVMARIVSYPGGVVPKFWVGEIARAEGVSRQTVWRLSRVAQDAYNITQRPPRVVYAFDWDSLGVGTVGGQYGGPRGR